MERLRPLQPAWRVCVVPPACCRVKAKRDEIADVKKKFAKSEDDLKALQVWASGVQGGVAVAVVRFPQLGKCVTLHPHPPPFPHYRPPLLSHLPSSSFSGSPTRGDCLGPRLLHCIALFMLAELRPNHWRGVEAAGR